MKEKTISANQAGLILTIFTVALKLSVLPAIMCDYSANNSYIACFFALIIDFILTILIISIMKKTPDKTFFELIKDTLTKPVAIIIYVILAFYFLVKCIACLLELYDYYIATLFDELNPLYFLLTLILLFIFLFNRNFRTFGRLIEISFWPMVIGISLILIFPIKYIELTNLFPIFEEGLYPIFNSMFHASFTFGDYMILLVLMGRIQFKKGSKKKILFYMSSILGFILNFYVVFIGTFGNTAVSKALALSELPLHNPYPATIGKLEWLTIIIWTAILIIQAGLLGKCCCNCISHIFNAPDNKVSSFVITGILFALYLPNFFKLEMAIKIFTSTAFSWTAVGIHTLLILTIVLAYLLSLRKNRTQEPKGVVSGQNIQNTN